MNTPRQHCSHIVWSFVRSRRSTSRRAASCSAPSCDVQRWSQFATLLRTWEGLSCSRVAAAPTTAGAMPCCAPPPLPRWLRRCERSLAENRRRRSGLIPTCSTRRSGSPMSAMLESKHPKDSAHAEERVRCLFKEALCINTWYRPAWSTMPMAIPSSSLAALTARVTCFDNHFLPHLEECTAVAFCRVWRPLLAHLPSVLLAVFTINCAGK